MVLYCMCHEHNDKPDSQAFGAANLYGQHDADSAFRVVALQRRMNVAKNGVKQVVPHEQGLHNTWEGKSIEDKGWRKHHPNVDFYVCPICGARICAEST